MKFNIPMLTVPTDLVVPEVVKQGYKYAIVTGFVYGGIQGLLQWIKWYQTRETIVLKRHDKLLGGITNVGNDVCHLLYFGTTNSTVCGGVSATFPISTLGIVYLNSDSQPKTNMLVTIVDTVTYNDIFNGADEIDDTNDDDFQDSTEASTSLATDDDTTSYSTFK